MKKLIAVTLLLVCIFAVATLTGKEKTTKTVNGLTPYTIPLPDFVGIYFDKMPEDPDNPLTVEGIALGRQLFYDKKLSANQTLSCGSCHKQEFAFADNRKFSLGVHDSSGIMNSMSLFNLGWAKHFFWDGRAPSLPEQANDPIINQIEMSSNWADVLDNLQKDKDYPQRFKKVFGTEKINAT
ncbi:MAG: cytochrome-c peroxidase, partial [Sphingobacteriales bacterium]